jgi:hypothetical protein
MALRWIGHEHGSSLPLPHAQARRIGMPARAPRIDATSPMRWLPSRRAAAKTDAAGV